MAAAMVVALFRLGVFVFGLKVDHQHAQRHAHLDRGKADAGVIHRVEHVGHERAEFVVERFHRGRDLLEARIGNFKDFADSHGRKIGGVAQGRKARDRSG
jgi:hypothetical protein